MINYIQDIKKLITDTFTEMVVYVTCLLAAVAVIKIVLLVMYPHRKITQLHFVMILRNLH